MKSCSFFGLALLVAMGMPMMLEAQDDSAGSPGNSQLLVQDQLLKGKYGLTIRTTQYTNMNVRFHGFGPVADEARKEIIEDSAILNQLITEAIPSRQRRSLGISVNLTNVASYIEGAGMLFFYNVNFVVTPSDNDNDQNDETDAPASAWEQAKEAVRNSQGDVYRNRRVGGGGPGNNVVTYDETKIEELKSQMTMVLGHAGNFRNLSPADTITIYVYGPAVDDQRSVMAWRVTMSDANSDGQVPTDKIEMTQYFQKTSSVSAFNVYGSGGSLK